MNVQRTKGCFTVVDGAVYDCLKVLLHNICVITLAYPFLIEFGEYI